MPALTFTDTAWQLLGTGITVATVQASGKNVEVNYTAAAVGFSIPSGVPVSVPEIAAFGGAVHARSTSGVGSIRYETA